MRVVEIFENHSTEMKNSVSEKFAQKSFEMGKFLSRDLLVIFRNCHGDKLPNCWLKRSHLFGSHGEAQYSKELRFELLESDL